MTHQLDLLLESMGENKRYIEQLLSRSLSQGNASQSVGGAGNDALGKRDSADILLQCSMPHLAALLNNLNHLTRISHSVADAVMSVQKKRCALQEVELANAVMDAGQSDKTYTLKKAELENVCLELMRCYEERFGLGETSSMKWYSDSGDTVIERRSGLEGQELLGLVQDMDASEAQYTLKYRHSTIFGFCNRFWPEFQRQVEGQQKIIIPRACYFDLLAYHKILGSDWYRKHYSLGQPHEEAGNSDWRTGPEHAPNRSGEGGGQAAEG